MKPYYYLLTNLLHGASPSWELTGFQLVKKFLAFYGTWRFITAVTSASHLFLPWASSIQSIPLHPTSRRSILISSSHLRLGLPSGLFPSGLPTKPLIHASPFPHTRYMRQSISFFSSLSPEQYWVRNIDHSAPPYVVHMQYIYIYIKFM